jgi:hypothetical protein
MMIDPKPNHKLNALDGAKSDVTPWTFVRAAGLANLIVATMVFVEFSGIALVKREPDTFRLGLWLVPFVTVVVWGAATVLCLLTLAPGALLALGQRLVARCRSSLSAGSGVWDEWLDSPGRHDG